MKPWQRKALANHCCACGTPLIFEEKDPNHANTSKEYRFRHNDKRLPVYRCWTCKDHELMPHLRSHVVLATAQESTSPLYKEVLKGRANHKGQQSQTLTWLGHYQTSIDRWIYVVIIPEGLSEEQFQDWERCWLEVDRVYETRWDCCIAPGRARQAA